MLPNDIQKMQQVGAQGTGLIGGLGLGMGAKYGWDSNEDASTPEKLARATGGALLGAGVGGATGLATGVGSTLAGVKIRERIKGYSYSGKPANFGLPLVPNVPFEGAPPGVRPLVAGSQIGALIGGGMGLEQTLQDAQDEDQPLPKTLAKGALNVAGGATLGTLTGLGGGVLLNRARGVNNAKALDYANKYTFGDRADMSYSYMTANFANLTQIGAGVGAVKGMLDQPQGQMIDPESGNIVSRTYTPLERLTNIGMNAAVGGGLGYGASKLGLDNPRQVGRYMGYARNKVDEVYDQVRPYIPEVEIRTNKPKPLPTELQNTLNAVQQRNRN